VTALRPDLPDPIDAVIARALAKDRDARYGSCSGLIAAARAAIVPPMLRLHVTAGNAAGTELEVDDQLVLGRHAPEEGQLENDPELSRSHARISRDAAGGYAIEDLGSTNGTWVNGERIAGMRGLVSGDTIEVGATTLLVELPQPATAPETDDGGPSLGETVFAPYPPVAPPPVAPVPAETLLGEPITPVPGPPPVAEPPPPPSEPPPPPPEPAPVVEPPPPPAPVSQPPPSQGLPFAPPPPFATPAPEQTAPIEPEPVAPTEPEPAPQVAAPLSLRLEVDWEAREIVVDLGEDSEPIRLVADDGGWRLAPRD
jgi:FHA domain